MFQSYSLWRISTESLKYFFSSIGLCALRLNVLKATTACRKCIFIAFQQCFKGLQSQLQNKFLSVII